MTRKSVAITSGPTFSRRQVLAGLAGAGVVTIVGSSPVASAMRALAVPGSGPGPVLVNVFLRGGADGLNIVVPYGDPDYYRHRQSIAQARNTLSNLDGFFGLNQAFSPLYPLYQEGELAFIQAVGSNDPSRSHFTAMDNMDLAFGSTGWMQRALSLESDRDPLAGLSVGNRISPSLRGAYGGMAINRLRNFKRTTDDLAFMRPTVEAMYGGSSNRMLSGATERAYVAIDRLEDVTINPTVEYPRNRIGQDLREAAGLIKSDVGVRMVSVNLGGWDHHNNENNRMAAKGAELAGALAAFKADLGPESDRVLTLVMSEFGRTARQNGSGGTDHGHGNMMMVMGGALGAGGGGKVHLRNGQWVGLSDAELNDNRDLAITTDFRSVLAEALDRHMGIADDGRIFPRYTPEYLGLLSGGAPPPTTTTTTVGATTTTMAATTTTVATTVPTTTAPTTTAPTTTAPTTTAPTTTPSTTTPPPPEPTGFVTGVVRYTNGDPVPGVQVDLFRNVDGVRDGFLGAVRTNTDGEYEFVSPSGPHILTFIAPSGDEFIGGGMYHQPSISVVPGQTTSGVNASLLGINTPGSGSLGGTVTDADGTPVAGLKIDLFTVLGDGSRGRFLRFTRTKDDGTFRIGTPAGCYVLTMIAPDGRVFDNGRRWSQPTVCIEAGEARSDIDATLAP